jgi:hypothetical protein
LRLDYSSRLDRNDGHVATDNCFGKVIVHETPVNGATSWSYTSVKQY